MRCKRCRGDRLRRLFTKDDTPIVGCRMCRLVFSAHDPDARGVDDWYARYYSDRNTSLNPVTKTRYLELLDRFARYRRTGRLLDIGCGFGFFLATARERGWDVYGTEVSRSAPAYFAKLGLPTEHIFMGRLEDAGFEPGTFDVANLVEVIEHVTDPASVLRAAATCLRPGGLLYLTTPNFNAFSRHVLGASWTIIHPREHLYYFTVPSLRALLVETGFVARSVRTTGLNYYEVLDYVRGRPSAAGSSEAFQEARESFERHGALGALKAGANGVLSLTRLGDTIKVFAERA